MLVNLIHYEKGLQGRWACVQNVTKLVKKLEQHWFLANQMQFLFQV